MCLIHTDFPVPDGPKIIDTIPSGNPMFKPRRIRLRPNALYVSMNSTASGRPDGYARYVCHRYSSSEAPSGGDGRGGCSSTNDTRGGGSMLLLGLSSADIDGAAFCGRRGRSDIMYVRSVSIKSSVRTQRLTSYPDRLYI